MKPPPFLLLPSLLLLPTLIASADILVRESFNGANPWAASVLSPNQSGVTLSRRITAASENLGTSDPTPGDIYVGAATKALELRAVLTGNPASWNGAVTSPALVLPTGNNVTSATSRAALTISFDLMPSGNWPIELIVENLASDGVTPLPNQTLRTTFTPKVANSYYRYSFNLSELTGPVETFNPANARLRLSFRFGSELGWPRSGTHTLHVDNVSYVSPQFYVRASGGNDGNSGRSEGAAFATIQEAIDRAQPGHVIMVMDGTYRTSGGNVVYINGKSGAPDAWIVLRNYPGHSPVINARTVNQNGIRIDKPSCYIEIRGLEVRGDRPTGQAFLDKVAEAKDRAFDGYITEFNTNGISVQESGNDAQGCHHLKFVNNRVINVPGGGLNATNADYLTYEGNFVSGTCYFTRYGTSGLNVLHSWNFDNSTRIKTFIIENTAAYNRTYSYCGIIGSREAPRFSDGNGCIIDNNSFGQVSQTSVGRYVGRTLVANNVIYGSGGAGIAITNSVKVDIINNTLFRNVQTPELQGGWNEIHTGGPRSGTIKISQDVRIRNNLVWGERRDRLFVLGGIDTDFSLDFNVFYGDTRTYPTSGGNRIRGNGDGTAINNVLPASAPQLVNPTLTESAGPNFRPLAGSSVIDRGNASYPGIARRDREGAYRPIGGAPEAGAYEFPPTGPTAAVSFSPPQGTITPPTLVTLASTTPGAIIYYTTNNTAPTTASPHVVSGAAIPIASTSTVRARALAPGYALGAESQATFTVGESETPPPGVVRSRFTSGNGSASAQQYPGVSGDGWAGPWTQSSAVTATVSAAPALRVDSGNHLRVARNGGTTSLEGVTRQWAAETRPTNTFTRFSFDVRLDSTALVFDNAADNFTIYDRQFATVGGAGDSSFYVRVAGGTSGSIRAREWTVFNGTPGMTDGYATSALVPTGLICEPGVTYTFTIDVYAADAAGTTAGRTHGTSDVTITDGTTTVRVNGAGFRTNAYTLGSHLGFATQQSAETDNLTFSLDNIEITALNPAPLSDFATWQATQFPASTLVQPTLEESVWGASADPDEDGIDNLLEYATNTIPNTPNDDPITVGLAGGRLTARFTRLNPAPIRYIVEASNNMTGWSAIATLQPNTTTWILVNGATATGINGPIGSNGLPTRVITITDGPVLPPNSGRFLRLRVEEP